MQLFYSFCVFIKNEFKVAKKYVRGYTIEDIKKGMKVREKSCKEGKYAIIRRLKDVHNVEADIYDKNDKKIGSAFYCFDKTCEYEYDGGKLEILSEINHTDNQPTKK